MHIQKVKYIFIVMLTLSCGLKKFFQNIKIIVFQYIFCFFCWPNFLYWFLSKRNLEMSYFPLRAHFSTGPFASPFVLFLPHSATTVTEWRFFLFSEYLSVSSITLHFSKTTMLCSWVTAVLECGGERWFWTAAPPAVLEWGGEPWFDACSESPSKHWFVRRLFLSVVFSPPLIRRPSGSAPAPLILYPFFSRSRSESLKNEEDNSVELKVSNGDLY